MSDSGATVDRFTILHVSDVHFGAEDDKQELPRIADGLIKAAHLQTWIPDLCVFSGDLAHSALADNFEQGAEWLSQLLFPWPSAKLFVVPGNHDVERDEASLYLRHSYQDEKTYAEKRQKVISGPRHLDGFFKAHKRMKTLFGDRLVSDWEDPLGCTYSFNLKNLSVNILGVNTALLSGENDDINKLVIDLPSLNNLLGQPRGARRCVITVGHHPLNWLAPWNHAEVDRLLKQEIGSHLYLHGHQHDQSGSGLGTSRGESLAVLECGAAYQGSKWPQYFSVYRLLFEKSKIENAVFALSPSSGRWTKNNERSSPIAATLLYEERPDDDDAVKVADKAETESVSTDDSSVVICAQMDVGLEPSRTPLAIEAELQLGASSPNAPVDQKLRLEAQQLTGVAHAVAGFVNGILDREYLKSLSISRAQHRIKDIDKICAKVLDAIKTGKADYGVEDVEDVCGHRYVTLFQSDIPAVIDRILDELITSVGPCTFSRDIKITVHTARPDTDPLSIRSLIEKLAAKWLCKPEYIMRVTGYTSVHVVLKCAWRGRSASIPVEIQFRSGLEEFWGQLDHKLRYYTGRGTIGDSAWQRHLNVLKLQFDAAIQNVDLLKESADFVGALPKEQHATAESKLSISTPEGQLSALKALPPPIYAQLDTAFALWIEADASRQFGGNPSKFREAADAFTPLLDGCPESVVPPDLAKRLAYTAQMERAYMLTGTNDRDNLKTAEDMYRVILDEDPDDSTALLRAGQVMISSTRFAEAVTFLNAAIKATQADAPGSPDSEAARIYDFARMNKAIVHFRTFENLQRAEAVRIDSIRSAILATRQVYETGRNEKTKLNALNDLVYYAWEELNLVAKAPVKSTITRADFEKYANLLLSRYQKTQSPSFRIYDTQCRVATTLGRLDDARSFAKSVLLMLESAARARGGGKFTDSRRFSAMWAADVMSLLIGEDEKDSLRFALVTVEGLPDP